MSALLDDPHRQADVLQRVDDLNQQVGTVRPPGLNLAASLLLFLTVAAAPLPFGSTDSAFVAVWCVVLGLGIIVAPMGALCRSQFALLVFAAIVIVAYAFVLHEQLATFPWISNVAPHPIWHEAGNALRMELDPSISISRNQPFFALGAPLVAMLSGICSFVICIDRKRARQLLLVVAWSGAAYAVYGIVSFLVDPTKILWREKEAYRTVLTSTFVNRNTAAVFFGSCAIVWLLLLCEKVREHLPPGQIRWKAVPSQLLRNARLVFGVSFSMFFVCLAAMFMTGSRAGVVLSLFVLVLAFTVFFCRDLPHRTGVLIAIGIGAAIALLALQIMGAGVSGRLDEVGLAGGGRLETYRSTWRMIAQHPWFGTGLGTFAWSYPAYRGNHSVLGVWDRAHNTLLELAADLGLPLTGLIIVAWIIAAAVLIRGVMVRRRDRVVPVIALSCSVLALLHSQIDFSLQIPGYAIVVFAVVGAGMSQSFRSNNRYSASSSLK